VACIGTFEFAAPVVAVPGRGRLVAERPAVGDQVKAQLQIADLWPKSGDGGRAGLSVRLRELDCHITPSRVVKNGMRTRSGSALLGVVIGADPAGLAAGPLITGEPGAAGMLWLWGLVADGGWSADEGQGRT
jgi:hypothetical protein